MRGRRNSSTASSTESLRERLRAAGLRSTGARVAVLRVLEGAAAPMSHAEVHERVTGEGFDRATIYRNLIDLTDAGLVSRSDVGDHVWRFELRGERAAHAAAHAHGESGAQLRLVDRVATARDAFKRGPRRPELVEECGMLRSQVHEVATAP